MLDTDSSSSTVPPKRVRKISSVVPLYILVSLFIINTGVLYTTFGDAQKKSEIPEVSINEVKDETSTLLPVAEVENSLASDSDSTESSNASDQEADNSKLITTYTVKSGDTISEIAEKFKISGNTIRFANDLSAKSILKEGDELVILPVNGVEYTIKKGDTVSGIALKFKVSQADILEYNDLDPKYIKPGLKIVVPNAEPVVAKAEPKKVAVKVVEKVARNLTTTTEAMSPEKVETNSETETIKPEVHSDVQTLKNETKEITQKTVEDIGKAETEAKVEDVIRFIRPATTGILTQGIHDGNAVDIGMPIGTPIRATASGKILVAKSSGYNGGYGSYIVIDHLDGTQTLYGHLSKVSVAVGETVSQGDNIGLSGNSGRSTGPHLHYKEIGTGTRNTLANVKNL